MTFNPRVRQFFQASASIVVLLAAWQIASLFLPALSVSAGAGHARAHGADPGQLAGAVAGSRNRGADFRRARRRFRPRRSLIAIPIGRYPKIESYITPFLIFLQGIPALSWVIVAIIWFHGTEFRIFFIMVITTLPAFTFQVLDSYRSMSKDLFEMTMSFRPSSWTLFRVLIVPTIVPGILTAWKINLGNSARVVVVAELVGATGGVGYELLRQQQLFDMAGALAWTIQLVLFVLVVQQIIVWIENWLLRYRAGLRTGGVTLMSDPLIRFRDVTKEFARPDGAGTFTAVDRLSFTIEKGEIVAVLGKTGCGKSTMFNLLAGLIEPTSGKVEVTGHDPFREFNFFRGKIGIVFQNDRLMPWRTALDNVVLGLEILDAKRSEAEVVARRWLSRLGLSGHENDYPHALSGGMRQRVSIARAFAVEPDILLCDEPFSSLDEMTARDLRAEFVRLVKQAGKTAVFITHHINEAMDVGDRIMVFHRPARIAYEARMDDASKGAGRQAIQDEILKVLSLEAGEGMPAAPAAVV